MTRARHPRGAGPSRSVPRQAPARGFRWFRPSSRASGSHVEGASGLGSARGRPRVPCPDSRTRIEAQRHAVVLGTPVGVGSLQDGGPAQQAAAWLADQVAGLQLAGGPRPGAGDHRWRPRRTTARAASTRPPAASVPRSARVLASLDPQDEGDLAALAGIAGLLQRHSDDPEVENALVAEAGGTGLLDALRALVPVGARARRLRRGGARLVAGAQSGPAACRDPGAEPHLRQHSTASRPRLVTSRTARTCRRTATSSSACSPIPRTTTRARSRASFENLFLADDDFLRPREAACPRRPRGGAGPRRPPAAGAGPVHRPAGARRGGRGRRGHRRPRLGVHPRVHQQRPGQPGQLRQTHVAPAGAGVR